MFYLLIFVVLISEIVRAPIIVLPGGASNLGSNDATSSQDVPLTRAQVKSVIVRAGPAHTSVSLL